MRTVYKKLQIMTTGVLLFQSNLSAQCGQVVPLGSASNMFTLIRNGNNPVAVSKALNTVMFVHRNNASTLGGNSGQLRFDISTNGGTTFTINQGVINPLTTNYARYPNMAIYNPSLNTNPANAYVSYLAPTIHTTSSAWNGIVSGVSQVNVTGVTESYNQNGIGTNQIPHSLVTGAPGVFWAIDPLVPSGTTGYLIYKGVWNSTSSDIVWNINYTITPPYNTSWSTFPPTSDYNIAFDPTGSIGYASFLGHVTPGSSNYALNPVLYKTINGGSTWTGPIQVDMSMFSCITSNTVSGYVPSANQEHDLVVDMNGNPHIITTVGSAANYAFNYTQWHHMYDLTLKNGVWAAYDLGNVNGSPFTSGTSPDVATQWQAPQASRTADGSKVFFTWTDNSTYSLGQANSSPNLYSKAFDVAQEKWTQTKEFTSCNMATAGKIIFPHLAPEVLEPLTNTFKLATVYGEMTVPGNLIQPANFIFLDNLTYTNSEFTVSTTAATVTIPQGPNLLVCPNGTAVINIAGNVGQALWSNGITTTTLGVTSSTVNTYSVVAQVGCNVGTASITVTNMTLNASAVTPSVCPGAAAAFSVIGNALGYTWTPGGLTGTTVILNPSTSPVTLTAMGGGSCTTTQTVNIGILSPPTITITGSDTICDGTTMIYTASGAAGYVWDTGATTSTIAVSPTQNTVYTVIGTGANSCTNTQTYSVAVKPSPTITAIANSTAICSGGTVALVALGQVSFSWSPGSQLTPTWTASPVITTIYTVTGTGANYCTTTKTLEVVVNPLPSLTVTLSRAAICAGEKGTLTATGANNYLWINPGASTPTVLITPSVTTVYTVTGTDSKGCKSTLNYTQAVSPCTGIEARTFAAGLIIYPNPSDGLVNIKCDMAMRLCIWNELGQMMMEQDFGKEGGTINHYFPPGIYFIKSTGENGTSRQKLVVR